MRTLLLVTVPALALFALALLMLLVPLPPPFPEARSDSRNLMAAVIVGCLGLVFVGAVAIHVVAAFSRPAQSLDPELEALGLTGRRHMLFGRQWSGSVSGRSVEVTYQPGPPLKPDLLQVRLGARLPAQAAVATLRPLLGCRSCPEVHLEAAAASRLRVFAHDQEWARAKLGRPDAWKLVEEALHGSGTAELVLGPDGLWLRRYVPEGPRPGFGRLLEDLALLAEALEDPPEHRAVPSRNH